MYENITFEKTVETLKSLVQINSISKNEQELAQYLKNKFDSLGFHSKIDRHGNMIASKKYSDEGVCLGYNSHMDTVDIGDAWTEDPFGCRMDGNIMYGLGSLDCKASMAALILAVETIEQYKIPLKGELVVTAVVQEEVQGEHNKGTVKMIQDGFEADMVIIGEPTTLHICRGCEGMVEVTIETEGVPTHGSAAEKGVNAITQMIKIINKVVENCKPGYSEILGKGSINVGVIEGGTRSSVVPDKCVCKVSKFVVEGETGDGFCEEIRKQIEILEKQDPAMKAKADCTYRSLAGVVPESTPLVGYFKKATETVMGKEAAVTGMRAHMDSDFLINMKNIPCVAFGPGNMDYAHRADEHIDITEVVTTAKVYVEALKETMK